MNCVVLSLNIFYWKRCGRIPAQHCSPSTVSLTTHWVHFVGCEKTLFWQSSHHYFHVNTYMTCRWIRSTHKMIAYEHVSEFALQSYYDHNGIHGNALTHTLVTYWVLKFFIQKQTNDTWNSYEMFTNQFYEFVIQSYERFTTQWIICLL